MLAKKMHSVGTVLFHYHKLTGVNVQELGLLFCSAGALFYIDPF